MIHRSVRSVVRFGVLLFSLASFAGCDLAVPAERSASDPPDVSVQTTGGAALIGSDTCTSATHDGHTYWFCITPRQYSSARSQCQSVSAELARIDSPSENSFIRHNLLYDAWIGANDLAVEGSWRWDAGGHTFSTGSTPTAGFFTNWAAGEPANWFNEDCGSLHRPT